ncbi:MAG: hypothetical protein ACLFPE_01460 [Bacteroidales bacterium]
MKNLAIILTSMFILASFTATAQMQEQMNRQNDQSMMMQKSGMMQGGMCPMCGQMMNQKMPMMKYMMMVNKLPDMQQQLSLSEDQVNKMIDLQTEFRKQQIDHRAQLTKKQMKMEKMLDDMPSAAQLKQQLQQCADTKIDMRVAAYETVKEMKALLTDEQKETLKNMMTDKGGMMQGGTMNR